MEDQMQQSNVSGIWKSLKTMSGQKNPDPQAARDQTFVIDLNLFFRRFD